MKLRFELEVPPEEVERVTPLLNAFKELSDSLSQQQQHDAPRLLASSSPRTRPKRPHDALLSASLSQKTPTEAYIQLLADGFSQAEISDAAMSILCDPRQAGRSPTRASSLVETIQKCGDGVIKVFKQSFVGRAVRELILPREYDCQRDEFMGFAEGLVALAGIGQVSGEAVLRTVRRLLSDESCWAAGLTLLCVVLERRKVTEDLTDIQESLEGLVGVEEFRYDLEYINTVTGWGVGET